MVPSVLDLLTLMDQDYPTPDQNYVDTLSEFYDLGVEDILDVFGLPCGLLASFGDLGSDRARQLHDYARDKLLLPLGLLETGLKAEVGDKDPVVKEERDSSIYKVGGQHSVIEVRSSSVVEVGGFVVGVGAGGGSSIIEMAVAETLPQVPEVLPVVVKESKEHSANEEEEGWPKDDSWKIKEECEERILEWITGVCEAGGYGEGESATSYEV